HGHRVRPAPPAGADTARRLRAQQAALGGLGLSGGCRRAHGRFPRARDPPQARAVGDPHCPRHRLRARYQRPPLRPLDFLGSIKLKLGIVIVAAVAVSVAAVWIGNRVGLSFLVGGIVAAALALALVQLLAHGMTFPLREMVAAAQAMARGDYTRRVTATSRDEVGELARAFNSMAAELEEVDRVRRDLVANASHELRTPIRALRARLENFVDGVEEPSQDALEDALRQVERLGGLVEQLLDLSKLESGAVPLERVSVSARELLGVVAGELREHAAAQGVRLDISASDELLLDVDTRRMHQVLANLV